MEEIVSNVKQYTTIQPNNGMSTCISDVHVPKRLNQYSMLVHWLINPPPHPRLKINKIKKVELKQGKHKQNHEKKEKQLYNELFLIHVPVYPFF